MATQSLAQSSLNIKSFRRLKPVKYSDKVVDLPALLIGQPSMLMTIPVSTTASNLDLQTQQENNPLTQAGLRQIRNKILKKKQLITKVELDSLGTDINLVGVNPTQQIQEIDEKLVSPKLLNWVEPYNISGVNKSLFYTKVNSGLKVGDRVFIIGGSYDSDLLIQKNKYKKGRDGYKVLFVEACKVVLDIDYTGILPYNQNNIDDFIKIYYIRSLSEFLHANREITTRSGKFQYKFSPAQNTIAFIDSNYYTTQNWGLNGGVTGSPGFYLKNGTQSWINITSNIASGSFSQALSLTYSNVNRFKVINSDFSFGGQEFKRGFVYEWFTGPTNSFWKVDSTYLEPWISKSNFRDGIFEGIFNAGIYGQHSKQINWQGQKSTWNLGTLLNVNWKQGQINSKYGLSQSFFSSFDNYGLPYQKANDFNNAGRGFNFVTDTLLNNSIIQNASIYNTTVGSTLATFSVVENEILATSSNFFNVSKKAFFDNCTIQNSTIENSELKNIRSINSKFERVKSINSYFEDSVVKNSNYNSDNIIKILGYDEFSASEFPTLSSTYSLVNGQAQKIFKFYISKESFERFKNGDNFYIKGLRVNDGLNSLLNFFDKKFTIGTWTEYNNALSGITNLGKAAYECSAFLSTPYDNSFSYTSVEDNSKYYTTIVGTNSNSNYHSIDIWVSKFSIFSGTILEDLDFNTGGTSSQATKPENIKIGNKIDISQAYIVDSDFESGIISNSNWNSGNHFESNNDLNITTQNLIGNSYQLSFNINANIIATTSYLVNNPEDYPVKPGSILFLDSVYFTYGTQSTKLPESYKVISNTNGVLELKELVTGTISQILSLTSSTGTFSTYDVKNRFGTLKRTKIDKSLIQNGIFIRPYILNSSIQTRNYNALDKEIENIDLAKNLVITDSIFLNKGNYLSSATYLYSFFNDGTDIWNNGIIKDSVWNGGIFSSGTIRNSRWIKGTFSGGTFYNSKSFNATASVGYQRYDALNKSVFYASGAYPYNSKESWETGAFEDGLFLNSDWESGTFSGGNFESSNWYSGTFQDGILGSDRLSVDDTKFFNGSIDFAEVNNATLYASDTSYSGNETQSITWSNGIFNNGIIATNINQTFTHSMVWTNGVFNGGEFSTNAKWKNGIFNGGKFISSFGWQNSNSNQKSDYSWETGKFNNGIFGNGQGLTNSTWWSGEFKNGIFKGRVWNDGVFISGEFNGSGGNPVSGLTAANANIFVDSFATSFYGLWRNGIVTDLLDRFNKNELFKTKIQKASSVTKESLPAKINNALWLGGTFSHPSGEFKQGVWLDGVFERGKFVSSSFNPYVRRDGNSYQEFNFDDRTCYWQNGELIDSDFYISNWNDGKFILGTATGMIWKNGIAEYMNAFNVFWENGLWRNGNWYGSSFEFTGNIESDYERKILLRGMSWSSNQLLHVWNIFQPPSTEEKILISATASTAIGGLVGNPEIAGISQPVDPGGGGNGPAE